ncbi:MAG: RNA polymerase sigma factor [Xanthomonadales bacterium]|jgi:RNA polymerase sigma-70 factor (ECF subfamily)|nr:RNA polymerase sigma factor [Xanthomonadales bacterium]
MQNRKHIAEFTDRVQAHQDIIHKVAFIYGRVPADREDLAQEILLQLWRSYGSFNGRSAFSTWMYRVALNTAITFRRKQRPRVDEAPEPSVDAIQPLQAELSDALKTLYRAIARLSAIEKAVIMQWLDERSYEEIADTVGISVKNVSVRLVRIRKRLAQLITEAEQT